MRKLISLLLIVSMLAVNLPMAIFAEENIPDAENVTPATGETLTSTETVSADESHEMEEETVQVTFLCNPSNLTLTLYRGTEEEKKIVKENVQGTLDLLPGDYFYTAECEGYLSLTEESLKIRASQEPLTVEITLEAVPAETEETVPETTAPAETEETVPETTAPAETEETVPETTVPAETEETVPETTVPAETEETIPETTVPDQSISSSIEMSEENDAANEMLASTNQLFPDVPPDLYCYDAVNWAVENNVTKGKNDGTFGTKNPCIRRHVVMFLWRAKGCPNPASMVNPFVDVKHDSFEKPILWAYYAGITTGKDATHFNPEDLCTRKQIVTFLWRAEGNPEPQGTVSFPDIKHDRFEKPILWAAEKKITGGYKDGNFHPDKTCTRGQIVTFLYRADPVKPAPEPTTIRMWFHGSTVTPDASARVMEELNKVLIQKLNVVLEPIWGTWGDFDSTVTTSLAGGEDVDIYFTCNWSADEYNRYAKDGYWFQLDDMLPQYAPELLQTIPQGVWDCAKTNGYDGMGIYAVPGLKDTATQNCWDVNVTLLEQLGYAVPDRLDYFSDEFEAMLQAAKDAKGPDFYPLVFDPQVLERMVNHSSIVMGDLGYGNILSYYYDAAHPSKDIGATIVNKFATPQFKRFAERTYHFSQMGFISPDNQYVGTMYEYRNAAQANGEYLFGTQSYAFGCERDFSLARGIHVEMIPETAPYMDSTSGQGAMMAISATSRNPEKALAFLNLLNTDPQIMTMLNYGLEGFTYNKNDDGTITFIDEARAAYSPWTNGVGNIRILPPTDAQGPDFWNEFAAYYDSAERLPYGSFIFDSSGLYNEAEAIGTPYAKYAINLMTGAVDPTYQLPHFLKELNDAGADLFVIEAQYQLSKFMR